MKRWRKALIGVMSTIVLYPVVFYAIVIPASIYNDNALVSAWNFPPVAILGGIAADLFLFLFYTPIFIAPLIIALALLLTWFPSKKEGALAVLLFALYFVTLGTLLYSSGGGFVLVGMGLFLFILGLRELRSARTQTITTRSGTAS